MSLNVKAYVGISKRKSIKKFEIGNKVQKSIDFNMQMVNHGVLSY
jgi:hypothetical protein